MNWMIIMTLVLVVLILSILSVVLYFQARVTLLNMNAPIVDITTGTVTVGNPRVNITFSSIPKKNFIPFCGLLTCCTLLKQEQAQ